MAPRKKTTRKTARKAPRKAARKAPARKTARKAPARKASARKRVRKTTRRRTPQPAPAPGNPAALPGFLDAQQRPAATGRTPRKRLMTHATLVKSLRDLGTRQTVDSRRLLRAVNFIKADAAMPEAKLPEEIRETHAALRSRFKSLHGAKLSLAWFPWLWLLSPCADKFGYLTPWSVRKNTRLPFNATTQALLNQLGDLMGDPGRENAGDSTLPAGFTYAGQFIDHDVTFDISSSLDASVSADSIHNMRTPALDLDSVYGRGPAMDPFLYRFPSSGPTTAIKFQLGSNQNAGPGGPAGDSGGMQVQVDWDVPRVHDPIDPGASTHTALLGDPRNDENLIVSQFHHAMLRFHNAVVDLLLLASFNGDLFVEAKRIVSHHYQWAVVNDFLRRICGSTAVDAALSGVSAPVNSSFRMPVEFSVAAYRFGHSMIRDDYWINFNFPAASLGQVFDFIRNPRLPVLSNWVVDFNAFFDTGVSVPVNNKARPIDSVLANGLESLPGFTGMMAVLAKRNLRRGLALGLPSGQGVASHFGVPALTAAELTQGLPGNEVALLDANAGLLKKKTPLWYYVLREAAVLNGGNQLGPVGARIVADTFVRMLKRDPASYLNLSGGFTPFLPSVTPGDFGFADLLVFAGVTQP